jgi:CxxH/CxxC protein (TIGR04129 family)
LFERCLQELKTVDMIILYACDEHIDEVMDEIVDDYAAAPELDRLAPKEAEASQAVCHFCGESARYRLIFAKEGGEPAR